MIKYEHNTLVLDSSHTKHDQKAVNDFVEYVTIRERERILDELAKLEQSSHETRTPLFQDTIFRRLRDIIVIPHPPTRFRDKANGE
jgi:hypothetical protein